MPWSLSLSGLRLLVHGARPPPRPLALSLSSFPKVPREQEQEDEGRERRVGRDPRTGEEAGTSAKTQTRREEAAAAASGTSGGEGGRGQGKGSERRVGLEEREGSVEALRAPRSLNSRTRRTRTRAGRRFERSTLGGRGPGDEGRRKQGRSSERTGSRGQSVRGAGVERREVCVRGGEACVGAGGEVSVKVGWFVEVERGGRGRGGEGAGDRGVEEEEEEEERAREGSMRRRKD
ncbi:hypothetical protein MPTK2_3g14200 [Marchantia polymorpha subsp. ruderalis]